MNIGPKSLVLVFLAAALMGLSACSSQQTAVTQSTPETTLSQSTLETTSQPGEAPTTEALQAAPSKPSGILAIRFGEREFGSAGWAQASIELTLVDVETGASKPWKQFRPVDGAQLVVFSGAVLNWPPFRARHFFSPDYDRVVAERVDSSDGSEHVGWITTDGQYVDVTDAVTPKQSDFADVVKHSSPQFGTDGMFYFLDKNSGEIRKVNPANLSPGSVTVVQDGVRARDATFDVYPDGNISVHGWNFWAERVENTDPAVFGERLVEDWLDGKTYLTNAGSQIYVVSALTETSQSETSNALLPSSNGRENWNPISSPDGRQVAFLTQKSQQAAPELFIVSRDGGDPARVTTDYTFSPLGLGGAVDRLQLLDWF